MCSTIYFRLDVIPSTADSVYKAVRARDVRGTRSNVSVGTCSVIFDYQHVHRGILTVK